MTGYILPLQPSVKNTFEYTAEVSNRSSYRQNVFATYSLKWRQNILWVAPHSSGEISFPVSVHQLVNRLKYSPVGCVCIDSSLGELHLNVWKEACSKADKRLCIRGLKDNKITVVATWSRTVKYSWKQLISYLGKVAPARA